jgi:hypothetical protein
MGDTARSVAPATCGPVDLDGQPDDELADLAAPQRDGRADRARPGMERAVI